MGRHDATQDHLAVRIALDQEPRSTEEHGARREALRPFDVDAAGFEAAHRDE